MSDVPLATVLLTHKRLRRLAAEEPEVLWPRALRLLATGPGDAAVRPESVETVGDPLPDQLGDPETAPLLRRGLRAFGRPRLRVRVVLRQGRLLTLTEVAATADGSAGSLSTLLLDGGRAVLQRAVRPVGRVELAGTAASALPTLSLRHVPLACAISPVPLVPGHGRPGTHPARTLVLRGWGRALTRPFIDAWAQDENGWVRPGGVACVTPGSGDTASTWLPVDADRFAADLAAVLTEPPWPAGPEQRGEPG